MHYLLTVMELICYLPYMEIGSEIVEQIKELEEAWLQRTGSRMQRGDESWPGSKGTAASAILYQEIQTGGLGTKSDLRCVFKSPGSTFDICV